jgi:hypothetical protein
MRYVNNRRPFLAKIREWVDTCTPYSVLCAVGSKNALCLIIHIMFECVVFPSKFISKLAGPYVCAVTFCRFLILTKSPYFV